MNRKSRSQQIFLIKYILLLIFVLSPLLGFAGDYPVFVNDDAGIRVTISQKPVRIVSLVPVVTEVIAALGADENLVGITYHVRKPARLSRCVVVGGFLAPSLERIKKLQPDLVFISTLQKNLRLELEVLGCRVVEVVTSSLADSYADIELVGRIVGRHHQALELIEKTKQKLQFISRKIAQIPLSERRRVLRMMGRDTILVPGDDSFQNEVIAAAGGIAPKWGKNGNFITISTAQIKTFNPQFIYACDYRQEVSELFSQAQFTEIEAISTGNLHFFPCALTCRASIHVGEFVEWLAASIYPDYFSDSKNMLLPEKVDGDREIDVDIEYVKRANVIETTIADFGHRTLVVDMTEPMLVLSTLDGFRQGISSVGNHYLPPPTWNLVHLIGPEEFDRRIGLLIARQPETTSLLFTGADMQYLVQKTASFKKMRVTALVTAGVTSNALRMGADEGHYYELDNSEKNDKPGTINIIILTNTRLTAKAMSRALTSACEGKSAALQDLDIRSSANPAFLQATGTGTDNIIVVEGRGPTVKGTGGHSKMGELIARAVYAGVIEAVRAQNSLYVGRSIFHRLKERRVTVYNFITACQSDFSEKLPIDDKLAALLTGAVEKLLLDSRYRAFVEGSLALSDAFVRGQIVNLKSFRDQCARITQEIAGSVAKVQPYTYTGPKLPEPLSLALEALVSGAKANLVK
ncbi:adenosylcobinamide amidohydrolase [bacterium]|nr:adenosylcobinamide amidohydrolase [bacterium]